MPTPRSILYPVDFSERCREIWPAVASMSQILGAPVTMLHVWNSGLGESETPVLSGELAAIRAQLEHRLARFPGTNPILPEPRREMAYGHPASCIVRHAAGMEHPLIMMSTRGHTRFRALLLGSVTAGILHDSPWPVWTDAHRECHAPHTGQLQSIVCAVDMGDGTPDLLRAAKELSVLFGARLSVVHSVPGLDSRFPSGVADRAHAFLVQQAREQFPLQTLAAGFDAPLGIVEDIGLAGGVARAALEKEADLLIIGRGSVQGILGRLRTNAHDLIRLSPCPVLSL